MRRTSRGWHFKVPGEFTKEEILAIRKEAGDCLGRYFADKVRAKIGMRIGILFYYKNHHYANPWKPLDMKEIFEDLIIVNLELKK
jgi:hypothetical protein